MINAQEADSIIQKYIRPLASESIALKEAHGRVLAKDSVADQDVPSFDNAAMDGFAVRYEDVVAVPVTLDVTDEIPAGIVPEKALKKNETMNIMTGAVVPPGCTAVVQQEWVERIDDIHVKILKPVNPGHNIRKAGADVQRGAKVLDAGKYLRPQEIGILASLNKTEVPVFRMPVVAVLTTGNEVVDIGAKMAEGKIRNSNAYVLSALVRQYHCSVVDLGIARDDTDDLRRKVAEGLAADMLITSGGVSVGKYDFVRKVLEEAGVEIHFQKVNIKPGMPLLFGVRGTTAVFGLPGNPVSSMVTFLKFVKPALMKMSGRIPPFDSLPLRAKLVEQITKTDNKRHFVRGIVESFNGVYQVRTTGSQVSNVLSSLSLANCLITLPEGLRDFPPGTEVEIELL